MSTSATENTQATAAATAAVSRAKLSKTLPTDRIPFPKQLEMIRAYAAASEKAGGPVSNLDVGKFIGLADSTVATANAFFSDVGLIAKADGGKFLPSQALMEHFKVYQLSPDRSWAKLSPLFERSWIGLELIPKLKFRPLDENEAVTDLALIANAEKKHYPLLKVGIDWMAQVGLISREGGQLRLSQPSVADSTPPTPEKRGFTDLLPQKQPSLGGINFAINLNVDMQEMATWPAENVKEFFAGVAAILAAKAAAERKP